MHVKYFVKHWYLESSSCCKPLNSSMLQRHAKYLDFSTGTSSSAADESANGYTVVARSLAQLGIRFMYGVIGIPVTELASAAQVSQSVSHLHLIQPPRADQMSGSDRHSQHPASHPHLHIETWSHAQDCPAKISGSCNILHCCTLKLETYTKIIL